MGIFGVIAAIIASLAVIAMLYAVAWCIYDVLVRAGDVGAAERFLWVLVLLGFNVLGAGFYVWFGPGRLRWAGAVSSGG